jgi:predicted phosphodiesterase
MILVITHYLPSIKCIPDKYKNDEDNDQFYSNLEHLVEKVNLWVCGHTHVPIVAHVNKTPIIINPKGNPGENPIYDTKCTFSIYSKL